MKPNTPSLILAGLLVWGGFVRAQAPDQFPISLTPQEESPFWIHLDDPSFDRIPEDGRTVDGFLRLWTDIARWSSGDQWSLVSASTDDLGWTHYIYHRVYQGIPVFGQGMVIHCKGDRVIRANGQASGPISMPVQPGLSEGDALAIVAHTVGIPVREAEPVRLEIIRDDGAGVSLSWRLAWRVAFLSDQVLTQGIRYIDARTGDLLLSLSTVCTGDVPGTANTYYSGVRPIVADQIPGKFRLQEAGRPIQTQNMQQSNNVNDAIDITDNDNQWTEPVRTLRTLTITSLPFPWWKTGNQPAPRIYLEFKDASNEVIARTPTMDGVNPPMTFPVQLPLLNPPYSIVYRDDDGDPMQDDFGGASSVNLSSGIHNFNDFGAAGSYEIVEENNAALDAHWCMEQTYDFYKQTFNRDSYDNAKGLIRTYVHFALGFANAFWGLMDNRMFLGDGDGVQTTFRTYINVVAHEFTHGVIYHNGGGGLVYQGESGALNESFADIFGAGAEFKIKPAMANWLHGEEGSLVGSYVRSMSDPHSKQDPDTYGENDPYWIDPADTLDAGGIHSNSGVQNYWFYLLTDGGSGTNANGDAYDVTGIGLDKAMQIAYRNLTVYLTGTTTPLFEDARQGSIQAASDLYGPSSMEVKSVEEAWYAVGVGDGPEPEPSCAGITEIHSPSGNLSDGSGPQPYGNLSDCGWRIVSPGANSITLDFTAFDLEDGPDEVRVYDGWDEGAPLLMTATGSDIPDPVQSSDGVIFIRFSTNQAGTGQGWDCKYQSGFGTFCDPASFLTDDEGEWTDGSGVENYGNLTTCAWHIQPVMAETVRFEALEMDTKNGEDLLEVFDGVDDSAPLLGAWSGTGLGSQVESTGPALYVRFTTDSLGRAPGWRARYEATFASSTDDPEWTGGWALAPNPTNGMLWVRSPGPGSGPVILTLWNALGQNLLEQPWPDLQSQETALDLSSFPPGPYLLTIRDPRRTARVRIFRN